MKQLKPSEAALVPAAAEIESRSKARLCRADPRRAFPRVLFELPWSREAKARAEARRAAIATRLDMFRDELQAIRAARRALSDAAVAAGSRAAAETIATTVFEIRATAEARRLVLLNRAHLAMTAELAEQLDRLESFRGRISPEALDALKERAFEEFVGRANRVSVADRPPATRIVPRSKG